MGKGTQQAGKGPGKDQEQVDWDEGCPAKCARASVASVPESPSDCSTGSTAPGGGNVDETLWACGSMIFVTALVCGAGGETCRCTGADCT